MSRMLYLLLGCLLGGGLNFQVNGEVVVESSDTRIMIANGSYQKIAQGNGAINKEQLSYNSSDTSSITLTAETVAGLTVALSWVADDSLALEYQLERKTAGGEFAVIASLASNVTSYRDPDVAPETTYTYRIRAVGDAGVAPYSNEIEITVESSPLPETRASSLVSNMLTPNGDFRNDTWVIRQPTARDVWVYDRSGQLVFQQNNYQNDWAGTARGKALEAGVYYYRIQWSDTQQSTTGFLTLVRQ